MKAKKGYLLLSVLVIAAMVTLAGCKKKEAPAEPAQTPATSDMQKQAGEMKETATETAETTASSMEQTMCPVMDGNKIDKNVFVEYKGKKVYFCCADCKAKFEADPEKYTAKLPQFQQQ